MTVPGQFDGELARIVPGRDRNVHKLSQAMRRADYPLAAIASVALRAGTQGRPAAAPPRDGADVHACDPEVDSPPTLPRTSYIPRLANLPAVSRVPRLIDPHQPGPCLRLTRTSGNHGHQTSARPCQRFNQVANVRI